MNKRDIPTEELAKYIRDYESEFCDATDFWSYVAGREHGKEIYPAPVPVKAKWKPLGITVLEQVDYTHPLELKNENS